MFILFLIIPFIIIFIGVYFRRIILSLFLSVFLSSFFICDFSLDRSIFFTYKLFLKNIEFDIFFSDNTFYKAWNIYICFFLLILGMFVNLLKYTKVVYKYSCFLSNYIKTKKQVEISSLIMSKFLFIDDYLSCLMVGTIMSPIADSKGVSRIKLAFLVDSLASPLVILCPISSWTAAIFGFIRKSGISIYEGFNVIILANPIEIYYKLFPFIFYSMALIISVWYIVLFNRNFSQFVYKDDIFLYKKNNIVFKKIFFYDCFFSFIFPILLLFLNILFFVLLFGDYFFLGGNNSFLISIQNTSMSISLFFGSFLTLIIITIFFLFMGYINIFDVLRVYFNGIKLMLPAVLILILAWMLSDLFMHEFYLNKIISSVVLNYINMKFIPSSLFLVSFLIAFFSGSAWGTASLLFPVVTTLIVYLSNYYEYPVLINNISPILYPSLASVLSGCVAGDHLSPVSDTTVMSSISCDCSHIDHSVSQLSFSLPFLFVTFFSYVIAGLLIDFGFFVSFFISFIFLIFSLFFVFKFIYTDGRI